MCGDRRNDFCMKLAMHTAPTLLGIKCASLISISDKDCDSSSLISEFNSLANVRGLEARLLCPMENRKLVLVYNTEQLRCRLSDEAAKRLLMSCGYSLSADLDEMLDFLSERIAAKDGFPHEIGVFLGYPIEDVEGFIANKGSNFKLCGCWKVYGSVDYAVKTFAAYESCKKHLCTRLREGADLFGEIGALRSGLSGI